LGNSKKIGNRNERALAKFFKEWTGWDFHRTPTSGGLHWRNDKRVAGDLVCPDEHKSEFPFCVETKTRKPKVSKKTKIQSMKIDIGELVTHGKDANIARFWFQSVSDAVEFNLEPIMFLRNKGSSVYFVFLHRDTGMALGIRDYIVYPRGNIFITSSIALSKLNAEEVFKIVRQRREE
jgi:Holliday junction resolvase